MGTASYVVTGKGNRAVPELLAARRRSELLAVGGAAAVHPRGPARGDDGHRVPRHRRVPRRDPGAYKDIDVVMADAADLVAIDHTLRQIVNVKGD